MSQTSSEAPDEINVYSNREPPAVQMNRNLARRAWFMFTQSYHSHIHSHTHTPGESCSSVSVAEGGERGETMILIEFIDFNGEFKRHPGLLRLSVVRTSWKWWGGVASNQWVCCRPDVYRGGCGFRPDPADYHRMSLKRETEIATAHRGSLSPCAHPPAHPRQRGSRVQPSGRNASASFRQTLESACIRAKKSGTFLGSCVLKSATVEGEQILEPIPPPI